MPLYYLDASALLKLYVSELGTNWVIVLRAAESLAISSLSIVEIASALARRTHEGTITPQQQNALWRQFQRDIRDYTMVRFTAPISRQAAGFLRTIPPHIRLRSLDAVHLASAHIAFAWSRRQGGTTGNFVSADRVQLQAAIWSGLPIENPEDYP